MEREEERFVAEALALYDEFALRNQEFAARCRRNDDLWRGRHWRDEQAARDGEPQPVTPVLFATLESMLADLMDNYPEPVLLGEEPSDDAAAEELTQVVRCALARCGYRKAYRDKCRQALKYGVAVQEVFWDKQRLGGLGDVSVRVLDTRSFLWDPAFPSLQDGRACFKLTTYPRAWLQEKYPALEGRAAGADSRRPYGEGASGEEAALIEVWHKSFEGGRPHVHMARMAGGVLLEDSRLKHPDGLFAHGQYPFVMEALYPLDGEAAGLGLVDVLGDMQRYADRMDQIILKNALMSGKLKLLVNKNADMDEDALTDWSREVVRSGRIDDSAVRWFQAAPVSPLVYAHQQRKLDAIRESSGQTSFNRGEASQGVTAAAAIMALQEAGNKRSRMIIEQMYDAFADVTRLVIALVGQFYTERRYIRVRGEAGERLVAFAAERLRKAGDAAELDVRVQVQKQVAYRTLYLNELAMQLLRAGVIDGQSALEMMDFEGRDRIAAHMKQTAGEMPGNT